MPAKKGRNHSRAPGETQITISLPKALKEEIGALAKEDDRSRSKWIVRELKKIIERKKAEKIAPIGLLRAAEEAGDYSSKKKGRSTC